VAIIALTTDFGLSDAYVGVMKGVILSIAPQTALVDICHEVPPQAVPTAAFILYQAVPYFPPDTIHLVVVDPGVGSARRAVVVKTQAGVFVAPDNGVLSMIMADTPHIEAVQLEPLTRHDRLLSATFHGRDVFAPAAARIAAGTPLASLGPSVTGLVRTPLSQPELRADGKLVAHVIHIDAFGNLILDATSAHTGSNCRLHMANHQIEHLSRTFADVRPGELLAYIGSTRDHLEIAVRNGNAARLLGLRVGDPVEIQTIRG
jgi:S-adenosyl-L-methionine hydrolase (adenosine-forming)